MFKKIEWTDITVLLIKWGKYLERGRTVTDFPLPVHKLSKVELEYTFRDKRNVEIPLFNFATVKLHAKRSDAEEAIYEAEFVDKEKGIVRVKNGFTFLTSGTWSLQFVAETLDPTTVYLPGGIIIVTVADNVSDLGLNVLPQM